MHRKPNTIQVDITDAGRLRLIDRIIADLQDSDDPWAPATIERLRGQRAQVEARMARLGTPQLTDGKAQVIGLSTLALSAKRG
jgi:hypothetical protein